MAKKLTKQEQAQVERKRLERAGLQSLLKVIKKDCPDATIAKLVLQHGWTTTLESLQYIASELSGYADKTEEDMMDKKVPIKYREWIREYMYDMDDLSLELEPSRLMDNSYFRMS